VKNRTLFFKVSLIGLAAATPFLGGCGLVHSWQTKRAYANYQAAAASGNPVWTRVALMQLVRLDEDVPDYWIELGKIDLQLGDYRKAFNDFSRAHELDRTNVQVLAAMTQLALANGQIDFAEEQAKNLALVAPDHPLVKLARSYVALQSGNLDDAEAGADQLLQDTPNDPNATILKARVLLERKGPDAALALLESQRRAKPDDKTALRGLAALYRSRQDWRNLAWAEYALHKLDPDEMKVSAALVEALLRAGNVTAANTASLPLVSSGASPLTIEATLNSWVRYASRGTIMPSALELAQAATGERKAAFANYFNRMGRTSLTLALLGDAQRPVRHDNARWNAVFAQMLALSGRTAEARQLFNDVLDVEPDQADALRGRAALEARMGMAGQAIIDAQRVMTISPTSGEDRVLLAQAYLAAGDKRSVLRTLWQAFEDLPDDELVAAALKRAIVSSGDADGARRLDGEVAAERLTRLKKELA
jgi:tetratricopeptide (TPR) repeat protein